MCTVEETHGAEQRAIIELLMDISLSERVPLVHPWPLRAPTWESPPFITCRTFPAFICFSHLSWHFQCFFLFSSFVACACVCSEHGTSDSLFSPFLLALSSVFFFLFLLSFRVRACTRSTAPRASPAPSRVSAGAGG